MTAHHESTKGDIYGDVSKYPGILIAVLIRNKTHNFPYFFFSYFENLNYAKDRIES